MRKTTEEWDDIGQRLQLREIPNEDAPRLLLECLLDRETWENRARHAIECIENLRIDASW